MMSAAYSVQLQNYGCVKIFITEIINLNFKAKEMSATAAIEGHTNTWNSQWMSPKLPKVPSPLLQTAPIIQLDSLAKQGHFFHKLDEEKQGHPFNNQNWTVHKLASCNYAALKVLAFRCKY